MSLRFRLTLLLMVPLVLVMGIHGAVRVRQERARLLDENRHALALTAAAIQSTFESALRYGDPVDLYRLSFTLTERQGHIDRIRLFDPALKPTLVSNALPIGDAVPGGRLRRVLATGRAEGYYERYADAGLVLVHLMPLQGPAGGVDAALEVVQLASTVEARAALAVRDLWARLVLMVAAVVVVTVAVLQRQVFRPLNRLLAGLRDVGRGGSAAPLPIARRDELGRVAEAFNEMTAQLEAARRTLLAESERALDLEQQLRHAETVAVAGRLASGVAHEIGTPLNIISGRTELLLDSLPPDDPRRRDVAAVMGQIDRIATIIRALLDLVRPQKAEVQRVTLAEALEGIWPLMEHAARRRGLTLEIGLTPVLPAVMADPRQLQQVVINLLVNAFEACAPGGRVVVAARTRPGQGRRGVALLVADTGPGMAPDVAARVLEPFFTTKPAGQGTGLGLPIARDIILAHGGDIGIESRPGAGTTVTVWLPAADEA